MKKELELKEKRLKHKMKRKMNEEPRHRDSSMSCKDQEKETIKHENNDWL